VDLEFLDPTGEPAPPPPDLHTAAGLAHAARGDWHAAALDFAAALWDAESGGGADADAADARRAAALTNLGQARAYLGALDEAATLLERSVAAREALVARGAAEPAVVARGLTDLAAVQAAAGDRERAAETLRRAQRVGGDAARVAEALALLGGGAPAGAPAELPWLLG
jgi:tetratricopeptide (TPR) repeat protein